MNHRDLAQHEPEWFAGSAASITLCVVTGSLVTLAATGHDILALPFAPEYLFGLLVLPLFFLRGLRLAGYIFTAVISLATLYYLGVLGLPILLIIFVGVMRFYSAPNQMYQRRMNPLLNLLGAELPEEDWDIKKLRGGEPLFRLITSPADVHYLVGFAPGEVRKRKGGTADIHWLGMNADMLLMQADKLRNALPGAVPLLWVALPEGSPPYAAERHRAHVPYYVVYASPSNFAEQLWDWDAQPMPSAAASTANNAAEPSAGYAQSGGPAATTSVQDAERQAVLREQLNRVLELLPSGWTSRRAVPAAGADYIADAVLSGGSKPVALHVSIRRDKVRHESGYWREQILGIAMVASEQRGIGVLWLPLDINSKPERYDNVWVVRGDAKQVLGLLLELGMLPDMTPQFDSENPFEVLGLYPVATLDDVKAAYRQLVKKYHPDKVPAGPQRERAEANMQTINAAYQKLLGML